MRIISKESDYYDHAMMYGQDDRVIWIRKPEVGHADRRDTITLSPFSYETKFHSISVQIFDKCYRRYVPYSSHTKELKTCKVILPSEVNHNQSGRYHTDEVNSFNPYKVPIAVSGVTLVDGKYYIATGHDNLVLNPACLQYLRISEVLDPYQLFNQLESYWLSKNEKPIDEPSDKTKIIKAGFDKYSFRKRK